MKSTLMSPYSLIDNLQRVDVILVHQKHDLVSWLIRAFTHSYWNHVALVYLIQGEYKAAYIIESTGGGVQIHNFEKYLDKKYDIAVKRLEAEWFNEDLQKRVRGLALEKIDAAYDYHGLFDIAYHIITRTKRVGHLIWPSVKSFICSGIVQAAYYEAIPYKKFVTFTDGDLLECEPCEIAQTPKLKWKYKIINGVVYI
jgi:hypothetical protein